MRLIGLLNYIYTLKMKTLTLLFSLFLMCPLSVWGQSADELLSKVSDALSEGKDDYAVSLFRQAANAGEDRTEMFYWTNVDKSSEVAPRLADVLAVHYKEMRNYDKAYLFYKEFLQRHPEDVPALVSCAEMEMMRGKEKDALKTYEKVLMLDADNLQANIFLGNYYYLQAEKDKKKLEEDYKKITSPTRMQYARYRNGLSDVFTNSYGKRILRCFMVYGCADSRNGRHRKMESRIFFITGRFSLHESKVQIKSLDDVHKSCIDRFICLLCKIYTAVESKIGICLHCRLL